MWGRVSGFVGGTEREREKDRLKCEGERKREGER
jgi:hypothetical protein